MLNNIPHPGDLIRVNIWNGLVKNVYVNGDRDNPVIEILFAKDIFKSQAAEFHRWQDLAPHTITSTPELLAQEIATLKTALETRLHEFSRGL